MRRDIVVDGTFLKNKYKGVLLVATILDGNSNLYYIAFGVVDSENERSWEWFMRKLKVVIANDHHLAFISDRHVAIGKALENIPTIGNYLREADVQKWARCQFLGYIYDIRTTNPAESINSALRSPGEYPVIPLIDSVREMLSWWFYKCKKLISKHKHPLTKDVEKKIDRRTGRTCSYGNTDLMKIPCRHAIKAGFHVCREPHTLTDLMYTTGAWIEEDVEEVNVLPPDTRRSVGRKRKRRYKSAEDKIRSSQTSQKRQPRKCSRCGMSGHNKATCEIPI
uniref:MULE transposase domain-containing protein n=1 Tax=Brassica oleracea var. oleracea TaxID=109376 RepID=A0A0D3CDV2_BRAOL